MQSPLRLDSNTVYFAGTPVYSSAVATVTLMCDKTKHKGPKLTSRAFWFCLPDNSPVSVSPLAGIIAEGKVCVMTKLNILHWKYVITYWNVHTFIRMYVFTYIRTYVRTYILVCLFYMCMFYTYVNQWIALVVYTYVSTHIRM